MLKKLFNKTPTTKDTIAALWKLEKVILDTLDFNDVVQKTVESMLTELNFMNLGYEIIVLLLVDKKHNVLKRIALSQTPAARKIVAATTIPFEDINIPLDTKNNILIQTINSGKNITTTYWPSMFSPILHPDEALKLQSLSGIKTSMVYPVISRNDVIGAMIFSLNKTEKAVSKTERELIEGFTDIVGLAVQNAQLYSSLADSTDKLKRANERLKSLDHMKDEFLSIASHELRTPMTIIKSYLWMVLSGKGGALNDKQKFYINRAYLSSEHLISFVNDMLNVSRIESNRISLKLQAMHLDTFIHELSTDLEVRTKELGLRLIVEAQKTLPRVLADPDKLREVFMNLIGNSLKFTPSGGTITVHCKRVDEMVHIAIIDTGIGVKAEDMPKLFKKFSMLGNGYATKNTTQGTGLGLYITKSIINLHGGTVEIYSEGEGKGTTFTFTLPIYHTGDNDKLYKEEIQPTPAVSSTA